jgi:hypothetical protein
MLNYLKSLKSKLDLSNPFLLAGGIFCLYVGHWLFSQYMNYSHSYLLNLIWIGYYGLLTPPLGFLLLGLICVMLIKGLLRFRGQKKLFTLNLLSSLLPIFIYLGGMMYYQHQGRAFEAMKIQYFKKHSAQFKQVVEEIKSRKIDIAVSKSGNSTLIDIPASLPAWKCEYWVAEGPDGNKSVEAIFSSYPAMAFSGYFYFSDESLLKFRQIQCYNCVKIEDGWYYYSRFTQ